MLQNADDAERLNIRYETVSLDHLQKIRDDSHFKQMMAEMERSELPHATDISNQIPIQCYLDQVQHKEPCKVLICEFFFIRFFRKILNLRNLILNQFFEILFFILKNYCFENQAVNCFFKYFVLINKQKFQKIFRISSGFSDFLKLMKFNFFFVSKIWIHFFLNQKVEYLFQKLFSISVSVSADKKNFLIAF